MIPAGVQVVNQYTPTGVSTEKGPANKTAGNYDCFFLHGQHRSIITLARVYIPITTAETYNPECVYKINFLALLQIGVKSSEQLFECRRVLRLLLLFASLFPTNHVQQQQGNDFKQENEALQRGPLDSE